MIKKRYPHEKHSIDIGLAVACSLARRDETLSQRDLAELCGCTRTRIDQIEKRALDKIRRSGKLDAFLELA